MCSFTLIFNGTHRRLVVLVNIFKSHFHFSQHFLAGPGQLERGARFVDSRFDAAPEARAPPPIARLAFEYVPVLLGSPTVFFLLSSL